MAFWDEMLQWALPYPGTFIMSSFLYKRTTLCATCHHVKLCFYLSYLKERSKMVLVKTRSAGPPNATIQYSISRFILWEAGPAFKYLKYNSKKPCRIRTYDLQRNSYNLLTCLLKRVPNIKIDGCKPANVREKEEMKSSSFECNNRNK
jgi:hypothetical protein